VPVVLTFFGAGAGAAACGAGFGAAAGAAADAVAAGFAAGAEDEELDWVAHPVINTAVVKPDIASKRNFIQISPSVIKTNYGYQKVSNSRAVAFDLKLAWQASAVLQAPIHPPCQYIYTNVNMRQKMHLYKC
jgi:hypothetical protein